LSSHTGATSTMNTLWLDQLATGVRKVRSSAIRDLLVVTEKPDMISFAGGLPAPECFPTEELTAAAERVLVERPVAALQYGPTEGYRPLRDFITSVMRSRGLTIPADQVLTLNG